MSTHLLAELVDAVNGTVAYGSIGITVVVGGTVLSGHLVSVKTWLERQREIWESNGAEGFAKTMRDRSQNVSASLGENAQPNYLHLVDIEVLAPGATADKFPGGTFRFRRDRIDGWVLGASTRS